MHVEVKVSVWKRIELPENASKEEVIKMLQKGAGGINDLFDLFDNLEYNEVDNSEETMDPADIDNQETIELYETEENDPIWTNKPEYPNSISLKWNIEDFESRAQEKEEVFPDMGDEYSDENPMLYDRSKFPMALSELERRHDCNYGVTWETIDYLLDEECLIIQTEPL
jgi:hypothetical protein